MIEIIKLFGCLVICVALLAMVWFLIQLGLSVGNHFSDAGNMVVVASAVIGARHGLYNPSTVVI